MAWAPEILIRAQVATVATTFVAWAFRASSSKSASLTAAPSTRPKLNSGSACGAMRKMCLKRMMPAASCVTPASTCDRRVRRRTRASARRGRGFCGAASCGRSTRRRRPRAPGTMLDGRQTRRELQLSAKTIDNCAFQCAGLTIFCQDCWTMSTVFLRSGGAIFEEVYSDARWCRSMSKMGNKNLRFFPVGLAALPEASSRLQGGLARPPEPRANQVSRGDHPSSRRAACAARPP